MDFSIGQNNDEDSESMLGFTITIPDQNDNHSSKLWKDKVDLIRSESNPPSLKHCSISKNSLFLERQAASENRNTFPRKRSSQSFNHNYLKVPNISGRTSPSVISMNSDPESCLDGMYTDVVDDEDIISKFC
uniref:Protein aurora borealis n=1 Tax=Strongyloides stercoralis TaxID=6248 RepID=A0A0K0EGH7_STRER